MVIVYAPVMDAIVFQAVKAVEFTNTGFEPVFDCRSCLLTINSTAKTPFNYMNCRATEYRCNGHI
jgi:hypothetical protein